MKIEITRLNENDTNYLFMKNGRPLLDQNFPSSQ